MKALSKITVAVAVAAALGSVGVAYARGWNMGGQGFGPCGEAQKVEFQGNCPGGGPGYGPGYGGGPGGCGAAVGNGPGYGRGYGGGPGPGAMMGGYGRGQGPMMGGPGSGRGPGAGYGPRGGGMVGAVGSLDRAQAALQLTPEQQGAWNAYADTVKEIAEAHDGLRDRMHDERWSNDPDRITKLNELRNTMHSYNVEAAQKLDKARADLYSVLTPEQKVTADQYLRGPRFSRLQQVPQS